MIYESVCHPHISMAKKYNFHPNKTDRFYHQGNTKPYIQRLCRSHHQPLPQLNFLLDLKKTERPGNTIALKA